MGRMVDNHGLSSTKNFMTRSATPDTPAQAGPTPSTAGKPNRQSAAQPVLEQLFALYPQLFGAEFLPLKLGVFQELLARHPEVFQRDSLKAALSVHTRSSRYLQSVAAGKPRHDLQGMAVEPVAPEHVCLALLELFRRRQARSRDDLRPKLRAQLVAAFEASGLSRVDYLARVQFNDEKTMALLEEALAEHEQQRARQEALLRAFEGSGKSVEEFAEMYGLNPHDVTAALARRRAAGSAAATSA
jgi:sRNA-binding protein